MASLCADVAALLVLLSVSSSHGALTGGMLYPRNSESRQLQSLDGMWNFRQDSSPNRNAGFEEKWYGLPLKKTGAVLPMPVPSSYNDIEPDRHHRDFVGWAWYDTEFFVSQDWKNKRVVLRFDSAHYYTMVWINSQDAMTHVGGHLPFEAEINHLVNFGGSNRVTVAVNNTLSPTTLPPGTIEYKTDTNRYPPGYFVQNLQFDFFNYAGIHRSVRLYSTPMVYVDDITITTEIQGNEGMVHYSVITGGNDAGGATYKVQIVDADGNVIASAATPAGDFKVADAHLWWPYTMSRDHYGYMYTLQVTVMSDSVADVYRQPFGIRTVKVTDTQFLINDQPFYCHGAAKHEDADIRGKGLDYPLIARDFAMMRWLGINCFRTSHYPYAEEIVDQASEQGIAVILESPGVGIHADNFGNASLQHHLEVMGEIIRRDKNKPCIIMWSVANEPSSTDPLAENYFKQVIQHTRDLDGTRPVTYVIGPGDYSTDKAAQFVDVICVNRYYGWYSDTGHLEVIQYQLPYDFIEWNKRFNKPMMITEYGADTVPGLHTMPQFVFTEDYQAMFYKEYHAAFDMLRKQFLVGEMIWNFADFMTDQSVTRVVGNKKGVLTRQREPKMAAYILRERYWSIINETLSTNV